MEAQVSLKRIQTLNSLGLHLSLAGRRVALAARRPLKGRQTERRWLELELGGQEWKWN